LAIYKSDGSTMMYENKTLFHLESNILCWLHISFQCIWTSKKMKYMSLTTSSKDSSMVT